MGYYTNYTLTVEEFNPAVIDEIEKIIVDEWKMEHWYDCCWALGEVKWYEHDKDMLTLSQHFPNVVFDLYGEGEDAEDMWHTYYKNGKKQHCPAIITFEPYDESKLE